MSMAKTRQKDEKQKVYRMPNTSYDSWFLIAVIGIIGMGLLMVASASMVSAEKQYHDAFYYLYHQLAFLGLGVCMMLITLFIPIRFFEKFSVQFLLLALGLLFVVLIPGVGRQVNGSTRWLSVGFMHMQVSELAKLFFVIYLASYIQRFKPDIETTVIGFLKPMILVGVACVLLLLEPDFGASVVIITTTLGMLFFAGVRLRYFVLFVILCASMLALLAISSPYRLQRLTTFLHPWANQYGSGYQLTQSLIAFGRGGIFGVGLGNSIQKLFYLPEAHTDFLFAVIAEELGLIGVLGVMSLFVLLVTRIMLMARRAIKVGSVFAGYMAFGFGLWIAFQAIVNIGVNAGILPTKGLTLPLMSYGGSSMLVNCIVIGLLLRIDYETKRMIRY